MCWIPARSKILEYMDENLPLEDFDELSLEPDVESQQTDKFSHEMEDLWEYLVNLFFIDNLE
jgi:hypothetical protein